MEAQAIETFVKQLGGEAVQTSVSTDVKGALAVRKGEADYYIGSCWTGAGGSLAIATAVLGQSRTFIVSMPGLPANAERVRAAVGENRVAFGISYDQMKPSVTCIIQSILEKESARGDN